MCNSIQRGINLFNRKLEMPQYKGYLKNEKAQLLLLVDCIKEELFSHKINSLFDAEV